MSKTLRIVLAQLNLKVGDIDGNLEKHLHTVKIAKEELGADVIVFPELSLTGYPPEDLLLRQAFLDSAKSALQTFIAATKESYCLIGHPHCNERRLFNACSLTHNGEVIAQYAKQHLPNYGVFDEYRYFIPGQAPCVASIKGIPVGIVICEDLWFPKPSQIAAQRGARLILSPNASPFEVNKHELRLSVLKKRAQENQLPIVYVNNVGGQDDLIFDGGSMVMNHHGELANLAGFFKENLLAIDIDIEGHGTTIKSSTTTTPTREERIYSALILGVRDYIDKNHFPGVLVGVSGGIDSALTLAVAVDALGKDRVHAVFMPSQYTADISKTDAQQLVNNLGVDVTSISIEPSYQSFLECLQLKDKKPSVVEENIQSRCRAVILMALSNQSGNLVLTTGNRSELAVGYCTLYGDMAGGFAVLKDVPKTLVYELARFRNQYHADIPQRILERPPTAELAPNQKDEDTLPPYSILDPILEAYLNKQQSIDEIVAQGFKPDLVKHVVNLIRKNEYKRRQSAVGPRINHKAFGKDRRYPITNGFKG